MKHGSCFVSVYRTGNKSEGREHQHYPGTALGADVTLSVLQIFGVAAAPQQRQIVGLRERHHIVNDNEENQRGSGIGYGALECASDHSFATVTPSAAARHGSLFFLFLLPNYKLVIFIFFERYSVLLRSVTEETTETRSCETNFLHCNQCFLG